MEHTRDRVNAGISAQMLKKRKFASLPDHNGCAQFWEPIGKRAAFALKYPYTRHGEGHKMARAHECYSQVITGYHAEITGVRQTCRFESINEGAIRVLSDRAFLTPVGHVIASMRAHAGGTVRAHTDDVVATENNGKLNVTLINRSYSENKDFCLLSSGTVETAKVYSGEGVVPNSFFEENTLISTGRICLTLPAHSIAVLQLVI